MWSKNGMPVWISYCPEPSRFKLMRISVSLVFLDFVTDLGFVMWSPKLDRERSGIGCSLPACLPTRVTHAPASDTSSHRGRARPGRTTPRKDLAHSALCASERNLRTN